MDLDQQLQELWSKQLQEQSNFDADFRRVMEENTSKTSAVVSELMSKIARGKDPEDPEILKDLIKLLRTNLPIVPYVKEFAETLITRITRASQEEADRVVSAVHSL